MGFMGSERMKRFLEGVLQVHRFEDMPTRLGVLATDLCTGEPVSFRDTGDVFLPIRASCSYPGLFQPVPVGDRLLVDGAMSIEVPALLARQLGATLVISVSVPPPTCIRPLVLAVTSTDAFGASTEPMNWLDPRRATDEAAGKFQRMRDAALPKFGLEKASTRSPFRSK